MKSINLTQEQLSTIVANAVAQALISASKLESKEETKEVKKTSVKKTSIVKEKSKLESIETIPSVSIDIAFQAVYSRFMAEYGMALPHKYRSFVSKSSYITYKMLSMIAKGSIDYDSNYRMSNGKTASENIQDLFNASISNGFISPLDFISDNRTSEKIKCEEPKELVASKSSVYKPRESVTSDLSRLEQVHKSREELLALYEEQLDKLGL